MHEGGRRRAAAAAARTLAGWGAAGVLAWGAASYGLGREDSSVRRLYVRAAERAAEHRSAGGDGVAVDARDALVRMGLAHRRLRSFSATAGMTLEGDGGGRGPAWREERRGEVAFRRPGSAAVRLETVDRDGVRSVRRATADGAGAALFPDPERDPLGVVHATGGVGWDQALAATLRLAGAAPHGSSSRLLGAGYGSEFFASGLRSLRSGGPSVRDGVPCVTVVGVREVWHTTGGVRETHTWRFGRDDRLLREHEVVSAVLPRGETTRCVETYTGVRANPDLSDALFSPPPGARPFRPAGAAARAAEEYPMPVVDAPSGGERAQKASRAAHALAAALAGYLWDHGMALPAGTGWEEKLAPYVPPGRSWELPAGPDGRPRRWVLAAEAAGRRVQFPHLLHERFGAPPRPAANTPPVGLLPPAHASPDTAALPPAFFEAAGPGPTVAKAPRGRASNVSLPFAVVTPFARAEMSDGIALPPDAFGGPPPRFAP